MKRILQTIISLLCVVTATTASAQTFHAIIFCNTIDESIGKSMQIEFNNVARNIAVIGQLLQDDYLFDIYTLDGPKCTRDNVKALIDGLEVGPDDVVLTFYGGHGTHAMNNEEDPWPQFNMNTNQDDKLLPMAHLSKWIDAKHPRLKIVLANCCNMPQPGVSIKPMWGSEERSTPLDGLKAANYRKLFQYKGSVMATSSKVGQYSWCRDDIGGLYTDNLMNTLNEVGRGQVAPDWEAVLSKVSDLTGKLRITDKFGNPATQNPYYKITPSGGVRPPKNDVNPPRNSESLEAALNKLVNKSMTTDARLRLIQEIEAKHFGGVSKVITIAGDMKTAVEIENPRDFLRRICLSDYISGMAVLSKDGNYLKVHELK